jgi:hypothetical protein
MGIFGFELSFPVVLFMKDYAHVFHYCQSCHTVGTTIMHSEDEFVLNAYWFKENDSDYLARIIPLLK